MVSEHMLTVGRDPRNWQAHSKDFFSTTFPFNFFYLCSLLSLFKNSLLWDHTPFPFWPHEDSTNGTTLRSTGYRTTKTTSEWRVFSVHLNNGNYNGWRSKTSRNRRLSRIPRFVWPRKATLMKLVILLKLTIPEIKVCRRKTRTWSVKT